MDATTAPSSLMTGASRAVALEVLLRGPLSRSEIARRLDLSAGSLTRLAKPLVDDGLLVEVDTGGDPDSGTVRRTRPLDINPDSPQRLHRL